MDIKLMSWNVRGLNDRARRDTVRTMVDDVRPAIVCLQETKLDVISQYVIFSMLGRLRLPTCVAHSRLAGRQHDVVLSDVLVGCFSVTVKVEMRCPTDTDASCWWLTCMYGPHDDATKTLFLDELKAIFLWLAFRRRHSTADRRARHGLEAKEECLPGSTWPRGQRGVPSMRPGARNDRSFALHLPLRT
jgi:hypothetical protein